MVASESPACRRVVRSASVIPKVDVTTANSALRCASICAGVGRFASSAARAS